MASDPNEVDTKGGSYVGQDVHTRGGAFIGRDFINNIVTHNNSSTTIVALVVIIGIVAVVAIVAVVNRFVETPIITPTFNNINDATPSVSVVTSTLSSGTPEITQTIAPTISNVNTPIPEALRFSPVSLSNIANASLKEGYVAPPLGNIEMLNIPFFIPTGKNSIRTQAEDFPDYPVQIALSDLELMFPHKVYILLTGGATRVAFEGRTVGEIHLYFYYNQPYSIPLIPGRNFREWKMYGNHNITFTSDSSVKQAWSGQNNFDTSISIIDMLIIELPEVYYRDILTSIEIEDISGKTVGNKNPAINLIGITVLQEIHK